MTDQEIIRNIRRGEREKAIRFLYAEYPKIKVLALKNGVEEQLAKELFNDSLLLLIEKVQHPAFELTAKLSTYLYGINRFLLKNSLRKQHRSTQHLEWSETMNSSVEETEFDVEKEARFLQMEQVLTLVSEKCRQLFDLFYFKNESMESIAQKLDFSSVNSAKTQKYKCLERAHALTQSQFTHTSIPSL